MKNESDVSFFTRLFVSERKQIALMAEEKLPAQISLRPFAINRSEKRGYVKNESDEFHYLIMMDHMMIQKRLFERVKSAGLTLGQPKVLDYLKDHDGARQKDIAAGCCIEAGSLTSILNRMEEKKMIERRMLDGDRRTWYVFMTDYGKELQRIIADSFREIEEQALDGISEEDRAKLRELLIRVRANMR